MVGAPLRGVALILFIVLAFALSLTGVLTPEAQAQQRETSVTVTRVVDGETVEISPATGGKTDVRLIGVDTSETVETSTEI